MIVGTVKDTSGAVVSNVVVKITNTDENTSRSVTTNDTGSYEALSLKPGHYSVLVAQPGFEPETKSEISL